MSSSSSPIATGSSVWERPREDEHQKAHKETQSNSHLKGNNNTNNNLQQVADDGILGTNRKHSCNVPPYERQDPEQQQPAILVCTRAVNDPANIPRVVGVGIELVEGGRGTGGTARAEVQQPDAHSADDYCEGSLFGELVSWEIEGWVGGELVAVR
ncbi:hypothetical protein V499_07335 [Pseudogymnoascus sp. VKM F-103]|nr:hypothetical protein V499_07335 [Pseudogymnoascus sp. VKM F-103]